MKKIFIILLALLTSVAHVSAQDAFRGPYATQKFGDNTFLGIGGGVNTLLSPGNQPMISPAVDIYAGKWFVPALGLRIGYQGLSLKEKYAGADFHEHFWMEPDADGVYKYGFNYFHGDVLWNLFQTLSGCKQRSFELIPYFHIGLEVIYNPEKGFFSDQRDPESCFGPGLMAKINFNKNLAGIIDVRDIMFAGRFHNYNQGGFVQTVSASAGLMYSFGNTVWEKAASSSELNEAHASLQSARESLASANAALASALAAKEALEARSAALASELESLRAKEDEKDVVYIKTALGVVPLVLYYEIGSKVLNFTERRHLDDYVKAVLKQDPERLFVLTGSADKGTGTSEINTDLSNGRAEGVKKILEAEYGVKSDRITIYSKISEENEDPRFDRSVFIEH